MIRLITTTRSRRFVLIASAIICFAYVDAVVAQKLEPIPPANVAGESPDQIKQIYKLTKAASKIEDYELIIQRCQKQLKQTLKSKDHKYLESLIVWSNNRIGQQHFQNSVSMKETGLNRQAEEELQRAIHIFDELQFYSWGCFGTKRILICVSDCYLNQILMFEVLQWMRLQSFISRPIRCQSKANFSALHSSKANCR